MPYPRNYELGAATESADDPLSSLGSEPLVPILRANEGQVDPLTLATWHQALSNTVSVEVPHDLMGLWLYPSQGGVVLLGPASSPKMTWPSRSLPPSQARAALPGRGDRSGRGIRLGHLPPDPVRQAGRRPAAGGRPPAGPLRPAERVVLQCVAQRVAPMLGRIARQWAPVEESSSRQQERIAGLLEAVAQANRDAGTPQRFLAAVTRGLAPLLPHDHVELLVPDAAGEQYFRLGEHAGGPLWTDPSLIISREHLDIAGIFDAQNNLLVADTYEDERWPRGFLTARIRAEPMCVRGRGADGLGAGSVRISWWGASGRSSTRRTTRSCSSSWPS